MSPYVPGIMVGKVVCLPMYPWCTMVGIHLPSYCTPYPPWVYLPHVLHSQHVSAGYVAA